MALVEDDPVYRAYVCSLLQKMPELTLIRAWESAEAVLADPRLAEVEMLFIDLELPGLGGLGLIAKLNEMDSPPQCVVLTSSSSPKDVFAAIRNGASGYLVKSGDPQVFRDALRQLIADQISLSPAIARLLVEEFRQESSAKRFSNTPRSIQSLTERERDVLNGLARLGSAKEVGAELRLSHETVRVHMKKIYQKLHVNSKSEAIAFLAQQQMAGGSAGGG